MFFFLPSFLDTLPSDRWSYSLLHYNLEHHDGLCVNFVIFPAMLIDDRCGQHQTLGTRIIPEPTHWYRRRFVQCCQLRRAKWDRWSALMRQNGTAFGITSLMEQKPLSTIQCPIWTFPLSLFFFKKKGKCPTPKLRNEKRGVYCAISSTPMMHSPYGLAVAPLHHFH